jgi:hypothetical protein
MTAKILSQARLHELLHYDPETGVFTWKKHRGRRAVVGSVAGRYHPSGHRVIRVDITSYYAHRLAWIYVHGSIPDGLVIDHINNVRDDNRLVNLRPATYQLNAQNTVHSKRVTKLQQFLKNRENT